MGFFDGHIASTDWNGDGQIDSWDDSMELAVIAQINDDCDREERISKMVRAIAAMEDHVIENEEFEELCRQEGLRMRDFDQCDIDEIQRRLNRY